jgi:hypothetical protein
LNGDTLTLGDRWWRPELPAGGAVSPQVEPRIHNGMLVALAEAYTPPTAQNAEVTARLDILRDESAGQSSRRRCRSSSARRPRRAWRRAA